MNSKKFRNDFGVYVCSHVFRNEADILESVRDFDGSWQFFCGGDHDFENEDCHLVGVGHLVARDESIGILANMEIGTYAERESMESEWVYGKLESES